MVHKVLKVTIAFFCLIVFLTCSMYKPFAADNGSQMIISSMTEELKIYNSMAILRDEEKVLTIDDVSTEEYKSVFQETKGGIPNFGYTDAVYWTSFEIHNTSDRDQWLLEVSYPPLERITLFTENKAGEFDAKDLGSIYPFSKREIAHRNYVFILTIKPGEKKQYYARIDTAGSMQLPFILWDPNKFVEKSQSEFIYLGIFYGVLIAMILYNLFLYFSLRHKSYMYYVFVMIGSIFSNLGLNGLALQYIWPGLVWWNHRAIIFFIGMGGIAALLFAKNFLETNQYIPKFKWIVKGLIGLNVLNIIILLFFSYALALNLLVVTLLSTVFSIIVAGFICFRRGARQARFFLLAWAVFVVGISITQLADAGLLPLTITTKYAFQITAAIEGILLSFALADKINIMRKEKELAQVEARHSQIKAVENLKRADIIKDEFLAITSHELRTPLYGIVGIAEALHDGVEGSISESMERQLSMIITSGKRLTNLVNDILDFSKLKNDMLDVKITQVGIYELSNVVIAMCEPLIKDKQIILKNTILRTVTPVKADQNRLVQILYNLIGNAIKYTNKGEVIISAETIADQLYISVTDTGRGISQDDFKTIFIPFQQADKLDAREDTGTGLGLSITKRLVELLDGTIEVVSEVGVGTTFTFNLPIYSDDIASDPVASEAVRETFNEASVTSVPAQLVSISRPTISQAKILIADDEPVNLQVLINQLSLERYDVTAVKSGEDVLSAVKKEQFDLLILDIMMPKMSGYEVARALRNEYTLTELPILMLTAKNQLHDKITSFEMGANDYLTKPCDKEELIARVKTLINLSRLTRELTAINQLLEEKVQERTKALKKTNIDLVVVNKELKKVEQSRAMLLSSISHELGTPITLIQSYIQAVNEGLIKDNNPRYLNMIQQKLSVLKRLTVDLFELAKIKSGHTSLYFSQVPFNTWLTELTKGLALDLEHSNRTFHYTKAICDDAVITVDAERLIQAFSNIVWNAVKHTLQDTGVIYLSVDFSDGQNKWDKMVRIHISDNGVGITKKDLPFIFERFYTVTDESLRKDIKGTGLGLAITKEIINFHNGVIKVTSEVNKGTTFTIELPLMFDS